MRKSDNARLLKALLISLILHISLFTAMYFINWFPETDSEKKYLPLSVKIESYPLEARSNIRDVEKNEKLLESSEIKTPVVNNFPLDKPISKPDTSSVSSTAEAAYDPYADLGISNNYNTPSPSPELPDEGVRKTEYIPQGENKIVYDDSVPEDRTDNSVLSNSAGKVQEEPVSSILSDKDIQNLETAINTENNQSSSESSSQEESDSRAFEYIDTPVQFDDPGVKRIILANPPPEIPDDLPSDFPPEITYSIRFRLNPDGMIQVLLITPSSVYPKIDESIRKALRSWVFKGSEGSEAVYGTITLIFKGK